MHLVIIIYMPLVPFKTKSKRERLRERETDRQTAGVGVGADMFCFRTGFARYSQI